MITTWMFCFSRPADAQDRPRVIAQQLFRFGVANDIGALILLRARSHRGRRHRDRGQERRPFRACFVRNYPKQHKPFF